MYRNPFTLARVSTVLRYATTITLNPSIEVLGATGSNVWQFAANGLYDPDTTGIGHQPMFYDNYCEIYQKYRVKQSKISVTVVNHSVNTQNGVTALPNYSYRMFILNDGTNGATSDYPARMEQMIEEGGPNVKWRFVAPSLTGRLPKLQQRQTPHRLTHLGSLDGELSSTIGSNPTHSTYFYVGIASADGVTDPPNVSLYVTIQYTVDFFDRNQVQPQN